MFIDNDFPKILGAELYRPHPAYIVEMAAEPVVVHDFSKQPGQTVQVIAADGEFRDRSNNPINLPLTLTEVSAGVYETEFWHRSGFSTTMTVQVNGLVASNKDFTSSKCSVEECTAIPTLSQWGVFIFGLLILNIGLMLLFQFKRV